MDYGEKLRVENEGNNLSSLSEQLTSSLKMKGHMV